MERPSSTVHIRVRGFLLEVRPNVCALQQLCRRLFPDAQVRMSRLPRNFSRLDVQASFREAYVGKALLMAFFQLAKDRVHSTIVFNGFPDRWIRADEHNIRQNLCLMDMALRHIFGGVPVGYRTTCMRHNFPPDS